MTGSVLDAEAFDTDSVGSSVRGTCPIYLGLLLVLIRLFRLIL